jgi:hypothetical protein
MQRSFLLIAESFEDKFDVPFLSESMPDPRGVGITVYSRLSRGACTLACRAIELYDSRSDILFLALPISGIQFSSTRERPRRDELGE